MKEIADATEQICIEKGSLVDKKMLVEGVTCAYNEYIPTSYNDRNSVPLLIMLHGASGSPASIDSMTHWSTLAEENNFIAVYPHKEDKTQWWDAYNWGKNIDDLFLTKLIGKMEKDYCIDTKRIFLCGYSAGGSMAVTYTLNHAEKIAAVALIALAWMTNDQKYNVDPSLSPKPKKHLPVYIWRGEEEIWPSLEEIQSVIDYWTTFNETSKEPVTVKEDVLTTYSYSGGKAEVLYTEVAGGTHNSFTPDYFKKIWFDFFSKY